MGKSSLVRVMPSEMSSVRPSPKVPFMLIFWLEPTFTCLGDRSLKLVSVYKSLRLSGSV